MAAYTNDPEEIMAEVRSRFQDLTLKIALPSLLAVATTGVAATAYLVKTDAEQDGRLDRIEDTRFTREDGVLLEGRLKDYMSSHYPPPWLQKQLDEIKKTVDSIDDRLHVLERGGD